jgi:hypothetical protein
MKYFLLALLFLASCRIPNKIDWAKECAERQSSRTDSVIYRTETVKVDTFIMLEKIRTAYVDTTLCPPSEKGQIIVKTKYLDCPPQLTVVKTRVLHDSIVIFKANLAAENYLKRQLDTANSNVSAIHQLNLSLKSDIKELKRKKRVAVWFASLGWLLVALFGFGTLKIWQRNR